LGSAGFAALPALPAATALPAFGSAGFAALPAAALPAAALPAAALPAAALPALPAPAGAAGLSSGFFSTGFGRFSIVVSTPHQYGPAASLRCSRRTIFRSVLSSTAAISDSALFHSTTDPRSGCTVLSRVHVR
jgi:hypothetical protein